MFSTETKTRSPVWQQALGQALRTTADLIHFGLIGPGEAPLFDRILARYQFLLPRYYASLIDLNDPLCPIRLQALPSAGEEIPFGLSDPLKDLAHQPAPRVTHRYSNRALMHLTPNCSMYCRFCFRKTLLNEDSDEFFAGNLLPAFEYFRSHPEVEEVILSGGDPLMVSDANLTWTLKALSGIASVKRIRIHSRVPVTFPERVTEELTQALIQKKPVVLITHFNHPKEITPQATQACRTLARAGVRLLNQSVLLKKVNASPSILKSLSEGLFEIGVLPYYLHHPDQAAGTAHFQMAPEEGKRIHEQLRGELSGYLVPRYVVDEGDSNFKRDLL